MEIQEKWQAERVERIESLNKAARDIAAALSTVTGGRWTATAPLGDDNDTSRTLTRKMLDGKLYGIFMHKPWGRDNKWSFSGSYPRYADGSGTENNIKQYNEKLPDCCVSQDKTPDQIAKDVARRLLPAYEEKRNKAIKSIADNNTYEADKEAAAKKIGKVLGVDLFKPERSDANYTAQASMFGCSYGEIEVRGGGSICFNLKSVPEALALELAAVLAKHKNEPSE